MGWWSESVMGGDTPLDIKGDFDNQFGSTIVTPQQAIEFIKTEIEEWGGIEDAVIKQVVGFQMMERGFPMNDDLRDLVIDGCNSGDDGWDDNETREQILTEFKLMILMYPDKGATVEMPHQPGLLEEFAKHLIPK